MAPPRRSSRFSSDSKQAKISTYFQEKETVDIFLDTQDLPPPKKRGRKPKNRVEIQTNEEQKEIEEHSILQDLQQDSINIETCASTVENESIPPSMKINSEHHIIKKKICSETVALSLFDTPLELTQASLSPQNLFTQMETQSSTINAQNNTEGVREEDDSASQSAGIKHGKLMKFKLSGDEETDNSLFCFSVAQALHKNNSQRTPLQDRFSW